MINDQGSDNDELDPLFGEKHFEKTYFEPVLITRNP